MCQSALLDQGHNMLMRGDEQLLSCWSTRGCQGSQARSPQTWPRSRLVENNPGYKYPLRARKTHPRIAQQLILGISVRRHVRRLFFPALQGGAGTFQGCFEGSSLREMLWERSVALPSHQLRKSPPKSYSADSDVGLALQKSSFLIVCSWG